MDNTEQDTCLDCKHFEERTGFCRCCPPTVVASVSNGKTVYIAVFPKVSQPERDYCSKFEQVDV